MKIRKFLFFLTVSVSLTFGGCSFFSPEEGSASFYSAETKALREKKIEESLLKIPGIKRVSVSLWGKTALVGFLTEDSLSSARAEELSFIITRTVLEQDKGISYVSVSKDPNLFGRITKLSES